MTAALRVSVAVHLTCALALALRPGAWPWLLALVAANHLALFVGALSPRSPMLGPNLTRLPAPARARGEVALTFDDGPDPFVTPRVLDLLERHGARASFFCVGARAAARPDLVRAIVARGHSVENHSARHVHGFALLGPRGLARDVGSAQRALTDAAGRAPVFFRAPLGFRSPFLAPVLARMGLRYVSWTRRGYDTVARDPRTVLDRLLRGLEAGDILVLHDGCSLQESSVVAAERPELLLAVLDALLAHLRGRGLKAVPLPFACRD